MIRINLLPSAKRGAFAATTSATADVGSGPVWVAVFGSALVLWVLALVGIYLVFSSRLDEQLAHNRRLEEEVAALTARSEGLADLQAKLEASQRLEQVVAELNDARLGPTRVLLELRKILSAEGGPTIDPARLEAIRRENPLAGLNKGWDVRRLWLTSFEESDRQVRITGVGRTNEDVAEFLQRLNLSDLFDEVTLEKTEAETDDETGLVFIAFTLSTKVSY